MRDELSTEVHPSGEEDLVFSTAGGKVALRTTREALTPYGGLVPRAAFVRHTGIIERLAASCPAERTSPDAAPVYDVRLPSRVPPLRGRLRAVRLELH